MNQIDIPAMDQFIPTDRAATCDTSELDCPRKHERREER
jgi:hypothetical protein